jgi:hypothetical protein
MVHRTKNQAKDRAENYHMEYKQFNGKEIFLLQIWLEKGSLKVSDFFT